MLAEQSVSLSTKFWLWHITVKVTTTDSSHDIYGTHYIHVTWLHTHTHTAPTKHTHNTYSWNLYTLKKPHTHTHTHTTTTTILTHTQTCTLILLVGAALVDLKAELDDDVEDDPGHQDPCGPPGDVGFAKVHSDEDVGDWNSKYHTSPMEHRVWHEEKMDIYMLCDCCCLVIVAVKIHPDEDVGDWNSNTTDHPPNIHFDMRNQRTCCATVVKIHRDEDVEDCNSNTAGQPRNTESTQRKECCVIVVALSMSILIQQWHC